MKSVLRTLSAFGLLAIVSVASAASPAHPAAGAEIALRHLTLSRSSPAANSSVAPPTEIRLTFSQQPQRSSTSITLTGAGGGAVVLGDVTVDPENDRTFSSAISTPLTAGSYTVAWRTMASDGHVIRGDFRFIVTAD
jgi:copper resistance protein C